MKGIIPSSLPVCFKKVAPEHDQKPYLAIENLVARLDKRDIQYCEQMSGKKFNFPVDLQFYKMNVLYNFSFDEICKIWFSNVLGDGPEKDLMKKPESYLAFKISNSMWLWGYGTCDWNEMVDTYNCLRDFVLVDDPDFELRLDHSTGYNRQGYTAYHRVYIDGIFGYFVYYKGIHVLTIGFSFMKDKRILLQQVQCAKPSGNRFLFKLPRNVLEHVISCFRRVFSSHEIFVVSGNSLVKKIIAEYTRCITNAEACIKDLQGMRGPLGKFEREWMVSLQRDIASCIEKIRHIQDDEVRLVKFYRKVGEYRLARRKLIVNGMVHYAVRTSVPLCQHFRKASESPVLQAIS